ncbi:MAG: M23 family metallopeptidase [Candidatus Kerfeldbacteria bacterium]|nr:M23 family metallopeptidase [Candidatus Kerfeldbacteria bacterium]
MRWGRLLNQNRQQINVSYLLKHHYTAWYLIILLGLLISWQNFSFSTVAAEEFGQRNLIYPLITPEYDAATNQLPENAPDNSDIINDTGQITIPSDVPIIITEDGAAILKPHLINTRPGVAGRERIEYYVIKSGDTLSSIAQAFGLNPNTILWENRLSLRSILRVGQRLAILPTNGLSYRVGRGDTIAKIAKKFGVASTTINQFNNLGDKLTVGQTLIIPGAKPIYTPPAVIQPSSVNIPSLAQGAPATISNTKLQWPTVRRRLTQYFTWRHTGIDIADSIGTPIYAAEDGIVEVAGWNRAGYGLYIIIDHGGGLKTLYSHNSKLFVTVGDRVSRGQQIAAMGSTGRSTGPHVHFEVRIYGRRTNPLKYVR